jgi:hypothetical protein
MREVSTHGTLTPAPFKSVSMDELCLQEIQGFTHEQKALYKSKIGSVMARNHQISAVRFAEV